MAVVEETRQRLFGVTPTYVLLAISVVFMIFSQLHRDALAGIRNDGMDMIFPQESLTENASSEEPEKQQQLPMTTNLNIDSEEPKKIDLPLNSTLERPGEHPEEHQDVQPAPGNETEMNMAFDYTNLYFGRHWMNRGGRRRHVTSLNRQDSIDFLKNRPMNRPMNRPFALKSAFFATHAWDDMTPPYQPMENTEKKYYNNSRSQFLKPINGSTGSVCHSFSMKEMKGVFVIEIALILRTLKIASRTYIGWLQRSITLLARSLMSSRIKGCTTRPY